MDPFTVDATVQGHLGAYRTHFTCQDWMYQAGVKAIGALAADGWGGRVALGVLDFCVGQSKELATVVAKIGACGQQIVCQVNQVDAMRFVKNRDAQVYESLVGHEHDRMSARIINLTAMVKTLHGFAQPEVPRGPTRTEWVEAMRGAESLCDVRCSPKIREWMQVIEAAGDGKDVAAAWLKDGDHGEGRDQMENRRLAAEHTQAHEQNDRLVGERTKLKAENERLKRKLHSLEAYAGIPEVVQENSILRENEHVLRNRILELRVQTVLALDAVAKCKLYGSADAAREHLDKLRETVYGVSSDKQSAGAKEE